MHYHLNCLSLLVVFLSVLPAQCQDTRPNILFIIADDWSHPHAGVYGDPVARTPHFDRIAREGLLFEQAYVSSPSCTPSRAAIVTGQHFWRLGIGANLYGPLPEQHPRYPQLLEESGYFVGYTRKGWGPGKPSKNKGNPAGANYESFGDFLGQRPSGKPFCFWFGSHEPHRGYRQGSGKAAGISTGAIRLPGCFPESLIIREDMADYYLEVQAFDEQIGILLAHLEVQGELDNTVVVVTSDNGMPFPRCKGNLYDMGVRMPLAIRWGNGISEPGVVREFVSLTDLAPTFLNLADVQIPSQMTGRSLIPIFNGERVDQRQQVFFGRERHLPGQEKGDQGGYPMRAVRNKAYLYIRNFRPDRWPAGTPNYRSATYYPAFYPDVDGSPTRSYMIGQRHQNEYHATLFSLAFGKRPAEELYDLRQDPNQIHNLAENSDFLQIKRELATQLIDELEKTNDPRVLGGEEIFESYPYSGGFIYAPNFKRHGRKFATVKIDSFASQHITTRSIEVFVPVGVEHTERFPVLYMFDGQNLFHSFPGWNGGINQGWQVGKTIEQLIENGAIPKVIVVGIFNSPQRMSEYMPAKPADLLAERIRATDHEWYKTFKDSPPDSDRQLKFLVEELKPFIDATFMTKPDRSHTFIAGSSMGGLISAYAVCEYPHVFGGAACLSTHWPPLDGVFLEYLKDHLPDPKTHKIYFDYGTEGLDAEYEPFQKIADQAMQEKGFKHNENWITRKFEGGNHHEEDWRDRFHIPLQFLLSPPSN